LILKLSHMNIEALRDYCMMKKGASESFPFDQTTLVFKVGGKMFAVTDLEDEFAVSLKCDPEKAESLREEYPAVRIPRYFNKRHWNLVMIDGSVSDTLIREWIDHSYGLVVKGLPAKERKVLEEIASGK
jgi:predicted DNA-binding protein (MmcQ/YjbR family)